MKTTAIISILFFASLAIAGWGEYHKSAQGFVGLYTLVEGCEEECKYAEIDTIEVREIELSDSPLMVTFGLNNKYASISMPAYYRSDKKSFKFAADLVDECQDVDCGGLAAIQRGKIVSKGGFGEKYIEVTLHFYQDVTQEVCEEDTQYEDCYELREWKEKAVYKISRGRN